MSPDEKHYLICRVILDFSWGRYGVEDAANMVAEGFDDWVNELAWEIVAKLECSCGMTSRSLFQHEPDCAYVIASDS